MHHAHAAFVCARVLSESVSKLGKWPFCLACCCRDIVPLGKVRSNFNFSLDGKRVLNFENVVTDDDNVKQVRIPPPLRGRLTLALSRAPWGKLCWDGVRACGCGWRHPVLALDVAALGMQCPASSTQAGCSHSTAARQCLYSPRVQQLMLLTPLCLCVCQHSHLFAYTVCVTPLQDMSIDVYGRAEKKQREEAMAKAAAEAEAAAKAKADQEESDLDALLAA